MSKQSKLSLDDQNKLDNNINCVSGLLELMYAGMTGEFASIDTDKVGFLILDAQAKLTEVRASIEILESA